MYFLPFTFLVPLISFILLYVFNKKLSREQTIALGVGSVFISVVCALICILSYLSNYMTGTVVGVIIWQWTQDISLSHSFSLAFDGLSILLIGIITFVGLMVHVYTVWYMQYKKELAKILGFSNLLLASMLIVVLSDNLLFLYLGWEGLGLACYLLLINLSNEKRYPDYSYIELKSATFSSSTALTVATKRSLSPVAFQRQQYQQITENIYHIANKFFILNRIGCTCLAIACVLIAKEFSTISIVEINHKVSELFAVNTPVLVMISSLLAVAGLVKSAQLPLHTWLIDLVKINSNPVMTSARSSISDFNTIIIPFLALIQSVTVVVAGVYLICRLHPLFVLTPDILTWWIGCIGVMTIVFGGLGASVQTDINRLFAYSTMSQVGFTFLALGVGAWQMAIFHVLAHAVTKSLLVLTAGAVTQSTQETNILAMGGLRHSQPFLFLAYIIGSVALIGLPFITVGHFPLEGLLLQVYFSEYNFLFNLAILGVFLTTFYVCRLGWYVFFGQSKSQQIKLSENAKLGYKLPLIFLMLSSTTIGVLFFQSMTMTDVLEGVLPITASIDSDRSQYFVDFIMVIAMTIGLVGVWALYVVNKSKIINSFTRSMIGGVIVQLCYQGFGLDAFYNVIYQRINRLLFVKKNVDTGLDTDSDSQACEAIQSTIIRPRYVLMFGFLITVLVTLVVFLLLYVE